MLYNEESEQAVLGGMLRSESTLENALPELSADMFFFPSHKTIVCAMAQMVCAGKPVDEITLVEHLRNTNKLVEAGGLTYVTSLSTVPRMGNLPYYVSQIKEFALRRAIVTAAERVIAEAENGTCETNDVLAKAQNDFARLGMKETDTGLSLLKYDEAYVDVGDRMTKPVGLKTGYKDLDRIIGAMKPGQLIVLAARPGGGKSALATNIAAHVAKGRDVAMFSLEMPREEVGMRVLCAQSNVNLSDAMRGAVQDNSWMFLADGMRQLNDTRIWLDDTAGITVDQIRSRITKLNVEHRAELVVIDYLQLITANTRRGATRNDEVTQMTRALKVLAKDLKVPIILLSQLSRESEKQNRAPRLSDLRESGSIEQDADVVMFLHCPDEEKPGEIAMIVAKQRNGPKGATKLWWVGEQCRFANYFWREEQ